jgi:primary-amine oxidase
MGWVSYADWQFGWELPFTGSLAGGGLIVDCALYKGRLVLLRGSAPFAIVPYHDPSGPFFKDGLGPAGGGVSFKPLKPNAPDLGAWNTPPSGFAANETEAVVVEKIAADGIEPAKAVVWAKLNVYNYQYIHRWEFCADGRIEPMIGVGGELLGSQYGPGSSYRVLNHIHNFYFRLDFALDGSSTHVVEEMTHAGNTDTWNTITHETKRSVTPSQFTRWRVRHPSKTNAAGQPVSYEIIPESVDPPTGMYSTGDLWTVIKKNFSSEMGAEVPNSDGYLQTGYGSGQPLAGNGVILWHVVREHHKVEPNAEDKITVPYHFGGFTIRPRGFLDTTPQGLYATVPASP